MQHDTREHSTKPAYPTYDQSDDELSLLDLWNIIWKRKWAWLTFGPLFAILGAIYALNQPELFKAETTLAPNTDEKAAGGLSALAGQFGGLASLAGVSLPGGGSTENAIATLKSRQFLAPFLTEDERLKALFPDEWNEAAKAWTTSNERRGADNRPTALEAYEEFTKEAFSISEDSKTGIVTVSVELRDPQRAANWANLLVEKLNAHLREQAKQEAEKNLGYLNDQLKETNVLEIKEALYGLIESQTKNAMLANAKTDFAFKVIDPAVAPEIKSKPKRGLIVVASGFFGGVFGIFICFILYLKDQNNST